VGGTSITGPPQLPNFLKYTPPSSFYSTSTTMPTEAYLAREMRFTKAIEALGTKEYTNITKCAAAFDVPRRTLSNRWRGMASKSTRIPAKRRLTDAQERSIVDYITRNYQRGMSLTTKHVEDAANCILEEGGGRITRVGQTWAKRFIKRHPDLKRRRQRTLASERKDAFNIEELELYFAQLQHVCAAFGIQIPDR